MKKLIYLPLLLLTLFVSVNKVSADTYHTISGFYDNFNTFYSDASLYSTQIDYMIEYWNNNLRSISSDYIIVIADKRETLSSCQTSSDYSCFSISLIPLTSTNFYYQTYSGSNNSTGFWLYYDTIPLYSGVNFPSRDVKAIIYTPYNDTYRFHLTQDDYIVGNIVWAGEILTNTYLPIKSSSELTLVSNPNNSNFSHLSIPSYTSTDFTFPQYNIDAYDYYPTLDSLVGGNYDPSPTANYVQFNVNDYDYVILSLKNYNQSTFRTDLYVQGQLCLTPVYNYGMTEKKNIITGSKNQECSTLYSSLSRVGMSVSTNDINNHAVYYIKAPSNNVSNIIKVDSSIFDITYISSSNTDPQVSIGGRSYPVIPYSELTDTAIISTNEGYISGQVCAVGDINCQYENGIGLDISDIFTQPLEVLKSVWSSITSVFTLITEFIMLIPSPLREFLIASFMLAIILGILKIVLG